MPTYHAPGVHIEHVITEPARLLRTGVPVFLGLVRNQDLDAYNAPLADDASERVVTKPIPSSSNASIVRKLGYLKLPTRPFSSATERATSDPSTGDRTYYLRTIPEEQAQSRDRQQVERSGGAAGQTSKTPAPHVSSVDAIGDKPPQTDKTRDQTRSITPVISDKPQRFTIWPQFEATYADLQPFGFLTHAVRGFFENDGRLCYVQLVCYDGVSHVEAVRAGLKTLEAYGDFDLVCVPDIMWMQVSGNGIDHTTLVAMQTAVLDHCEKMGDRFAILDSLPGDDHDAVLAQRYDLHGKNGALYYPWIRVSNGPNLTAEFVPPCGHIAGIFARSDQRIGVHKAPANEIVEGARDLAEKLNNEQQGPLNLQGINCLRAFPTRGIRVWGARTLSFDPAWQYINVRRVLLTAGRWIERNLADVVFEPHTPNLWARIVRDLTAYFTDLLEQGALLGRSAEEAFYIKCNAETNPPEVQEAGMVVTEIGLAPAAPAEFIVVRIIHGPTGVRIVGSA